MFGRWRSKLSRRSAGKASEDLVRSLGLILDPLALRASIASRVQELTGCDSVVMCELRPDGEVFRGCYRTPNVTGTWPEFPVRGKLCRWLTVNQEPMVTRAGHSAPFDYLDADEKNHLKAERTKVCLPLFAGTRLVGMLLIGAQDDWECSDSDLQFLSQLARQAALALENAELHGAERERLRNLYRAEQLAVAGQLAATVAHEIRNPLTAIRSTVQFVSEMEADSETRHRLLTQVIEEVDRIEHTVGGILALTRTYDGPVGPCDVGRTLDESVRLVEAYARANGITIERDRRADPLIVKGDSRGLQQVCLNLLLNACQAMPNGGRVLVRTFARQTKDTFVAVIQIQDSGIGISDEDIRRVFDPFFTTKPGGTGLGLPICVDVLTRQGGQLHLESAPVGGTIATVSLPVLIKDDTHGQDSHR